MADSVSGLLGVRSGPHRPIHRPALAKMGSTETSDRNKDPGIVGLENLMRYFFHLVKGTSAYKDTRGLDLPDIERAIAQAKSMARERADDDLWDQWSVLVVDAHDKIVLQLPITREASSA